MKSNFALTRPFGTLHLHFLLGLLCILCPLITSAGAQEAGPVPAKLAAQRMTLPPGFSVSLFAGEPDVVQPIAMTFDARGRLWVVECLSYPKWSKEGVGHDRVTIFEDTNQDGKHDKRTVFLDNGVNLTGIEIGFGGVWITATPNLLFVPDRNGDDIPDGPSEVVLDGWDLTAQHNVFNSLIWGPDGWLYGCNGILSHSKVGAPGTPAEERASIDCGVWRYHPQRKIFDVVASGSTNPWGLDFDEFGQAFITNCVIKHLFHIIPGAHYDRMFGQDLNPYAYELLPSCADHIHWGGGHWTSARGGEAHDDAGGGHAHSGGAIYLSDQFPAEYRNSIFMCNIHGNRLNRDRLERDGAVYHGRHAADFAHAHDPWFRGISIKCAPDGSLFFTDWTDTGECHNYEVVDASNGRVFRVAYGTSPAPISDLTKSSIAQLVEFQFSRNEWLSRQARRQLQERCTAPQSSDTAKEAQSRLVAWQPQDDHQAVRQVWGLYAVGGLPALRAAGLAKNDAPEWVRFWTIQLAADETTAWSPDLRNALAQQLDQPTPLIQRSLASTCQRRIRLGFAEDVQSILMRLLHQPTNEQATSHDDGHAEEIDEQHLLATLKWYAVEPLVASHTDWLLEQIGHIESSLVQRLIARRLMSLDNGLNRLTQAWHKDPQGTWIASSLAGVLEATAGQQSMPGPAQWSDTYSRLQRHPDANVRELSRQLSTLFGDSEAIAAYRHLLADSSATTSQRNAALALLVTRRAKDLQEPLTQMLHDAKLDTSLRLACIRGLAAVGGNDYPAQLLSQYANLTTEEKQEVVYALTSRLQSAQALLDAIESGALPRADVSSLVIRQLQALGDAALNQRLESVWGKVRPVSETKLAQIEQYRNEFAADMLAKADKQAGTAVYQKTCGACHKLFGEGGSIGPELTGGQRHNLDYLLDNIIDPNAIVPGDYRMVMLLLDDGRVLNGIVKEENPQSIRLQTATELVTVPHDQIEERRVSQVSMMPEGILDNLTPPERLALIGYLQTAAPVTASPGTADSAGNGEKENLRPDPDNVGQWHLLAPPWKSETVYGESVTLLQETVDGPLVGRLALPIVSIESIVSSNRSQDLTHDPGLTIDRGRGTFSLPANSHAPHLTQAQLFPPIDSPNSYKHRVGHPEQALLYGPNRWFHDHQVEVTYRHANVDWKEPLPHFSGDLLPRTIERLRGGQPLMIGCSGDSIAAGGDASGLNGVEPLQPAFPQLVQQQLRYSYAAPIELKNRAVGGWSIQNGLDDLNALLAEKPQLIIVAYGMNDVGRRDPQWFHDRMQEFIERVQAADATIEIVMVTPMLGHNEWIHTPREMFSAYRDQIAKFVRPGIALADVGAIWQELLKHKHDLDLTGNGLNHPNDFGHRLYAQTILALLIE